MNGKTHDAKLDSTLSPVYGFLKNPSLIDYTGHYSGVMFTSGCNFRCGFCHNAALTRERRPGLSWSKLAAACENFRRQWVDGIVITGGEPTILEGELLDLIKFFLDFGFAVKLDSNGSRPDILAQVLPHLDYAAMDIKCGLERYPGFVGYNHPEKIADSIALLKESNVDYEFRTTVIESVHDESEMLSIAEQIKPARRYILQTFIPRAELPDAELGKLPRTSPDYLTKLKKLLELNQCAEEVIIR